MQLDYGIKQYSSLKVQNPNYEHAFAKNDKKFNHLFDDVRCKIEEYNGSLETPSSFTC